MKTSRRDFLKCASILGSTLFINSNSLAANAQTSHLNTKRLVYVFLKGGVDTLGIIAPYSDPYYNSYRDKTALKKPGNQNGALELDDKFALHPSLDKLHRLIMNNNASIILGVGNPLGSKSHFKEKSLIQRGVSSDITNSTNDGWLSRYLEFKSSTSNSPFQGFGIGSSTALRGKSKSVIVNNLKSLQLSGTNNKIENNLLMLMSADEELYNNTVSSIEAIEEKSLLQNPGINYPENSKFAKGLKQLAQVLKSDLGTEVACIAKGGWDTHTDTNERLSDLAKDFSDSICAFYDDMGDLMNNTIIVVQSEFGRRVYENSSLGSDHGLGGHTIVIGGDIIGGQVLGQFDRLREQADSNNGNLAVTTDYRDFLGDIMINHFDMRKTDIEEHIFPYHSYRKPNYLLF